MLVTFVSFLAAAALVSVGDVSAQTTDGEAATSRDIARRELADANNAFGLDLYRVLGPHEGNLVISPLSGYIVLAMAWMGAAGETAQQLGTALLITSGRETVSEGVKALLDSLQGSKGVDVRIANKMFIHQNFTVKDTFQQLAVNSFRSGSDNVDFRGNNEVARQAINEWVQQNTEGKIQNLFPQGTLSVDTVMVLVNAVFFKGEWKKEFKEEGTYNGKFHTSANSSVTVPMMRGTFRTGHASIPELNCSAIELMYKDSSMRMVLFLPNAIDGLQQLEDALYAFNITELYFFPWEVDVNLPKFNIKSSLSLKEPLEKLGVQDLFSRACNLTNLTPDPNIEVSQVRQKVYVEVNEKGTTAAAASGVEFLSRSGRRKINMKFDHPFHWRIYGADNTILFMGRVANPSEG